MMPVTEEEARTLTAVAQSSESDSDESSCRAETQRQVSWVSWHGGLKGKCSHGHRHLNTWSLVSGTVWEGVVALPEEVHN